MTDWLRLLLGTAVVLAPGWTIARALGQRSASAALAWGLAAIGVALAATFAVQGSLWLTLGLVLGVGAVAAFRGRGAWDGAPAWTWLAGLAFGGALWFVCGPIGGDGLFHEARVRKLDALGSLSLRAVDEFRDGGLHPGYAFPLWHAFLALVAKASALDPETVVRYEPALLAPVAFAVVWESGAAVFRARWAGAAVLAATVGLYALAAGHGGGYAVLTNPGTAARQLLAPAGIALFFRRSYASLAAVAAVSALVHPAFTLCWLLPLVGYALARLLLAREWRSSLGLAAAFVPFGAALLWLRPIVAETVSHDPGPKELARALKLYRDQLDGTAASYHLAPEVFARGGALAVAALVSVPLAFVVTRRRAGALVLGGSLLVLALMLVPWLFMHFADAVSLSQARRAAGFLPYPFAIAAGCLALSRLGPLAPPLALAAGIALQLAYPGQFGGHAIAGAPAWPAWVAVVGGAAALAVGAARPRETDGTRFAALAAVALVVPVAVHGFAHWSAAERVGAGKLTPGLVHALRTTVPERAVVFSDTGTSYRIAAAAPVYVAAAPPEHVADTRANRPYARAAAARRFVRTGDLAIPRRFGAAWIVLERGGRVRSLPLPVAYADPRYVLYRLSP